MLRSLRRLRKAAGKTQKGLAREINVSHRTIVRWEAGASCPGRYLDILAVALSCRPEDLVAAPAQAAS